jgi:hypothetical protein
MKDSVGLGFSAFYTNLCNTMSYRRKRFCIQKCPIGKIVLVKLI